MDISVTTAAANDVEYMKECFCKRSALQLLTTTQATISSHFQKVLLKGAHNFQVLVRKLAAAADTPEGQQGAHDLQQLLADFMRPVIAEHVVLGLGSLIHMHIQLLLFCCEVDCNHTQSLVSTKAMVAIEVMLDNSDCAKQCV